MIFPVLTLDEDLQIDDKTRLDASLSYTSKDEAAVTLVEIQPEASASFIDVSAAGTLSAKNWYLDYQYSGASRTVTVTCRITTDGTPKSHAVTINVLTEADDYLFSNDNDIKTLETQIMKWLPDGRSSFKYAHRHAQKEIIAYFDEMGYVDKAGDPYTKTSVVRLKEVVMWASKLALSLIYNDVSDKLDDDFKSKSTDYKGQAESHKGDRAIIRLDYDGDGIQEDGENHFVQSVRVFRL